MSKKLLMASVLLLLGWGAQAQNEIASKTYEGNGDSRAVVMTGLQDGIFTFITADNRYLSGNVWNESGFVYDFETKKVQTFNEVMYAFVSPTHYVAAQPGENAVPYIFNNGQYNTLERTISHSTHDDDLSYWNATPDGNRLVFLAYEWDRGWRADGTYDSVTNPVGTIYNGKTGKVETLLHSYWPRRDTLNHEDNVAYGTRANAISADGLVAGGWGTWPTSRVISTWQTTFWDMVDLESKGEVYTYAIEDYRFSMSDLVGANRDGSILVGYNEETSHGLIIHYNRAAKSFTIDTIEPLPGYNLLFFNTVDDQERVYGYCGMVADPSTRKAVIYSEETGLLDLKTYLYEYYNIAMDVDLGAPTKSSIDGSILSGHYYDRGYAMPWFVQFGERILPRARNVMAKAAGEGNAVRVDWQKPLNRNGFTVTGYELYLDDIETPIATINNADQLSYVDETEKSSGRHIYYVVAVYGDQKADRASSNRVQTIPEGGTFPVQQIDHQLKYNRFASIYWGLPSSEVVDKAVKSLDAKGGRGEIDRAPVSVSTLETKPVPTSGAKYISTTLDFIDDVDMMMYTGYAGIKIGEKYYVSSWSGNSIRILDKYNAIEQEWRPQGLNNAVLSMVYIESKNQLLCGSLEKVYIIDMDNEAPERVSEYFDCPSRHLAYLEDFEFNGTKGVLMAGGWDSCAFYTLDGEYLGNAGFDFSDLAVTGTAYHKGRLYAASQTGKYLNEVYTFNVATRERIDEPIQLIEDPAVYNLLSLNGEVTSMDDLAVSGGMSICTLDDSTVALGLVYQCSYVTSRLMFLELESAPDRQGYTLYRNGEVYAENLTSRHFYDELSEPGTYTYEVEILSTKGAAPLSPVTTVTVEQYGPCLPAKNLTARETNQWVVLDWEFPTSDTAAGLTGFTVFRDNKKLKELWGADIMITYNDLSDLKLHTPYSYRVESIYSTGCKAVDSVEITLTGEGVAMAPFGIRVNYKKNAAFTDDNKLFDATVNWETPMFEEPLAIGYGTGQMVAFANFGDEDPGEYWALIGWDVEDLELYKDLYLVGMEYLLGDDTKLFEAVVYLNSEQVLRDKPKRTTAQAWQTMYFSKSFKMDQPKEVAVGYHIQYSNGAAPVAIDLSESKRFYSDIISFDGEGWTCLADGDIYASWAIRALVARKRDIDAATTDGVLNPSLLEGKLIRLDQPMSQLRSLKPTSTQTMAIPSPKAPLTLQGYNLYRQRVDIDNEDEIQLNGELMTTYSYTEAEPLPEGDYDYTVEAVYTTTTKPATLSVTLSDVSTEDELNGMTLTLYPNPASETVYVNGDYSRMEILDLGGRVLRRLPAASQIDLNGLTPGTYVFRFTDEAGRKATYKVVVK